jgi:hypothetical protein
LKALPGPPSLGDSWLVEELHDDVSSKSFLCVGSEMDGSDDDDSAADE